MYGYTSGAEALSVLRGGKVKIDIALVDILMPDMDGFKLLEIIGLEICKRLSFGSPGILEKILKTIQIDHLCTRKCWKYVRIGHL